MSGKRKVSKLERQALSNTSTDENSLSIRTVLDDWRDLHEALQQATQTIDMIIPMAEPTLAEYAEADFERWCTIAFGKSTREIAEMMQQADFLHGERSSLRHYAPSAVLHHANMTATRHEKLIGYDSLPARATNQLDRNSHTEISLALEHRSQRARSLLTAARTITMDYFHVSTSVMHTLRREGLAHSAGVLHQKVEAPLEGCGPPGTVHTVVGVGLVNHGQPRHVCAQVNDAHKGRYARQERNVTRISNRAHLFSPQLA